MKVTYKRDYHHSYLILTEDTAPDCESYPVRMLLSGLISGILPCKVHHIDNQLLFYYDITSSQSLASAYDSRKLRKEELTLLLNALLKTMEEMEAFLLSPSGLLLLPDYIFINAAEEAGFCYWPGGWDEEHENMREFAEYLLPKIDHCDQQAVVMGYHFYRKTREGQLCPEEMRKEMYQSQPEVRKEKEHQERVQALPSDDEILEKERIQRQKLLEEMTGSEEKVRKSHPVRTALCTVGGGLLIFVSLCLFKNRYFSWQVAAATAGLTGIVTALGIGFHALKKIRDKKAAPVNDGLESSFRIPDTDLDSEEYISENLSERLLSEENQTCLLYHEKEEGAAKLLPVSPAGGKEILLEHGITVFGKLEGAVDVMLDHPTVSRLHAKIVCDGSCTVYDMNSKNGTYVNNEAVAGEAGYEMQDGDILTFANLTYRLQFLKE